MSKAEALTKFAPTQKVKNKFSYYLTLAGMVITFGIHTVPSYFLNVFYDSITNPRNNNWNAETRKTNLSYISTATNVGGLVGGIAFYFISKYNPRTVIHISRVLALIGSVGFTLQNIYLMLIGRFIIGFAASIGQNSLIWVAREICVEGHADIVMIAYHLSVSSCFFTLGFASNFDKGGPLYWRAILLGFALILMILLFLDLLLVKDLNSITYMIRRFGLEESSKKVEGLYSVEVARAKIEEASDTLDYQRRQREEQMRRGVAQWRTDLVTYKKSALNLICVTLLGLTGLQLQYMSFGSLIGSKNLNNHAAVAQVKLVLTFTEVIESIGYMVVIYFGFIRLRKRGLLVAHFFGCMVVLSSAVGYLSHNLLIARFGILLNGLAFPTFQPSFNLYTSEIVPASLVFINSFCSTIFGIIMEFLFPRVMDIEQSPYHTVGIKFLVLAAIGFSSNIALRFVMIETSGLSPLQAKALIEGEKIEEISDEDKYLRVGDREGGLRQGSAGQDLNPRLISGPNELNSKVVVAGSIAPSRDTNGFVETIKNE